MPKLIGINDNGDLGPAATEALAKAGFARAAAGLPPGGAPGQVLSKAATADYSTQWIDLPPASGAGGDTGTTTMTTRTFSPSTELLPNPEQGWFIYSETTWGAGGAGWKALDLAELQSRRTKSETVNGYSVPPRSLLFRYVIMSGLRDQDTLPQAFLDAVAADFATARQAGVKLIIRFCYSNDGETGSNAHTDGPYGTDTTPARTLGHVAQLKPTIQSNKDVIHAVQAGLIGTWGEWYYSDNWGNKGSLTAAQWNDRARLVTALLDWGVDYVLLRYVGVKRRYIREGSGTGWTAPSDAAERLGFHNDAFQASGDIEDWGTFSTFADGMTAAEARAYLADETARPVPMVGETAGVSSRSGYAATAQSLAEHHWSGLNPNYHGDVLASWSSTQKDEVARKLGARLVLESATLPSAGVDGATSTVTLRIANNGWGAPLQDRPLQVVFKDGSTVVRRTLSRSVSSLSPGQHTITENVQLPSAPGTYTIHLALPDRSSSLASRPEYAFQLASTGVSWADGMNGLGVTTLVSAQGASTTAPSGPGTPLTLDASTGAPVDPLTDSRADIQAALNAAKNGGDRSYWSFLEVTGSTVELRPGTYRVSAPADGSPSIVVPRGVDLRTDKATLAFDYPAAPTTNWCGVLLHSRAGLTVGKFHTNGTAPDTAHTYDAIRAYMQDNWNMVQGVGGFGIITGFRGAGYRALGSYVIRLQNLLIEFCSHGIVHGHSGGLVTDGLGAYALPSDHTVTFATRRPTDMFVSNVYMNGTRGNNIVVGSPGTVAGANTVTGAADSVTGGNLYLHNVLSEDSPARFLRARELSQVRFDNVHLEELGAIGGPMIDIDVVYGNITVESMRINTSQKRRSKDLNGVTVTATPNRIWQLGSFVQFDHKSLYFQNSGAAIAFSGAESWGGAWTNAKYDIRGIAPDAANTGALTGAPLLPSDNFKDRVTNIVTTQR